MFRHLTSRVDFFFLYEKFYFVEKKRARIGVTLVLVLRLKCCVNTRTKFNNSFHYRLIWLLQRGINWSFGLKIAWKIVASDVVFCLFRGPSHARHIWSVNPLSKRKSATQNDKCWWWSLFHDDAPKFSIHLTEYRPVCAVYPWCGAVCHFHHCQLSHVVLPHGFCNAVITVISVLVH